MSHRPGTLFLFLTCTALLAPVSGCSTKEPAPASQRLSATAEGDLSIDPVPALDITGNAADGSVLFGTANSATRLSTGVIAVADASERSVHFFAANGARLHSTGRGGDGPGEFQAPTWMEQCRTDTLFVFDAMQMRVSVLDSAGNYVRQFPLLRRPAVLRCSDQGTFAQLLMPRDLKRPDPKTGVSPRYTSPLLLLNTAGDSLASLGIVALGETRPLGTVTRLAVAGDRVFVGTGDSAYVDAIAFDGRTIVSLPVGRGLRVPSAADYEAAIDAQIAGFTDTKEREALKRSMLAIPMPGHIAPYSALLTDPEATLWAVTSTPADSTTVVRGVTADSRELGILRFPGRLRIFEIGRNHVLGVHEDSAGQEHVVQYNFSRNR